MSPIYLDHDQFAIEHLRRDLDTWRAIARAAIHSLAAEHRRVVDLEAHLRAAREEAIRYSREAVECRK